MAGKRREFARRSERIEELVARVENAPDPAMRAVAQELLQAVIELHGVAFDRVLAAVAALPDGELILAQLAGDDLVSGVLSLHGIHPVPIATRVAAALEKTRPYLHSHGGSVELLSIDNGTVRIRFQGACGSCSSSADTMKSTVERAICDAAPEVAAVVAESAPAARNEFVILQTV